MKKQKYGVLLCLVIAIPSWIIGMHFPVIGGAVIGILAGMLITMFWKDNGNAQSGISWPAKYELQAAVVI